MFYEFQEKENQQKYKELLTIMGNISKLFSKSEIPYLAKKSYCEIFCKSFNAENLSSYDCSVDAKKGKIGIVLKTWTGENEQKIAEFGKLKKSYQYLNGLNLCRRISEYRNEPIRVARKLYGIDNMYYHIVKRILNAIQIYECEIDLINLDCISINQEDDKNIYFTDGKHKYHFDILNNTLYMLFDSMCKVDEINVEVFEKPADYLISLFTSNELINSNHSNYKNISSKDKLCLPLYSVGPNGKFVAERSGLNQWNASGRIRNADELYIPFNKKDREREPDFFPPRDKSFILHLPDGTEISAKVCQEASKNNPLLGKAIMSNPNKILGNWLLREVFELPEYTLVTYEMLEKFGVDSVIFTKNNDGDYSIDFSKVGTYEQFYDEEE